MHYNFSKLSELLLDVSRSKYSLSICWHISTRFLCDLTMLANLVSGNGVVKILKRWPKTMHPTQLAWKTIKKNKNYSFTKFDLISETRFLWDLTMGANLVSGNGVVKILKRWPKTNASNSVGLQKQYKISKLNYFK